MLRIVVPIRREAGINIISLYYKIGEWQGVLCIVAGNSGAAKGGEVGAGAEGLTDVFGEGANVGTA